MPGRYTKRPTRKWWKRRVGAASKRASAARALMEGGDAMEVGSMPAPIKRATGRIVRAQQFTRSYTVWQTVTDAATMTHYAASIRLDQLPAYTEFTSLFDQYRIKYVDVTFMFDRPDANVPTASANGSVMPLLFSVLDFDDDTALTSEAEYHQYDTLMISRMDKQYTRRFYPKVADALYSSAFTSYGVKNAPWIDCGSSSVRHYGLKYGWDASRNGGGGTVTLGHMCLFYRVTVEFRATI